MGIAAFDGGLMQDRPTIQELLQSVSHLLDTELVPALSGSRQFYARVAANVLRIVERELANEEEQLSAEWLRLDALLDTTERPATRDPLQRAIWQRTEELSERIRQGDVDTGPYREQVLQHLKETIRDKLVVSNPKWIERPEEETG